MGQEKPDHARRRRSAIAARVYDHNVPPAHLQTPLFLNTLQPNPSISITLRSRRDLSLQSAQRAGRGVRWYQ
jgi:hypothetical protein